MARAEFESAVKGEFLAPAPNQIGLPPWLVDFNASDFQALDPERPNAKKSIRKLVEQRLLAIAPLLDREEEILRSDSPEKEINQYARGARLNTVRVRLWFFMYLCSGRNMWSLLPRFYQCGHWDRLAQLDGPKCGRKSIARGAQSGARLTQAIIDKMTDAYIDLRAPGKYLTHIYSEAMIQRFDAERITNDDGQMRLARADGFPIPTIDQFSYQVRKRFGRPELRRGLYGNSRNRRQYAAHKGTFASAVSNLLERVESDGYYCDDLPKGYIDGAVLPPVCVVRGVDTASALRVGIGFSFGKERSEAYDAMLFCAAIPKKKFCALFGIDIEESEWPSLGLPSLYITDRGPGVKREPGEKRSQERYGFNGLIMRESTPSGQGQGKAIVESAQRRRVKQEGPAQYAVSDLSPYQMVQREIRRLLIENESAGASKHMTPEMIQSNVFPTPLGVWKFLDFRGRNDAHMISFEEAVRRFLKPVQLRASRDGVWLLHQKYDSPALRDTGLLDRLGMTKAQKLQGYLLPFCIRQVWAEVDGRLIELNAKLALRDDNEQMSRTFKELQQEDKIQKIGKAGLRQHRVAARADQVQQFAADTGKSFYPRKRTSRAPKPRSAASKQDFDDINRLTRGEIRD